MNNIEERANKVESEIIKRLAISSEAYLEMWYEYGCQYAEELFTRWSLTGKARDRAVDIYIKSGVFWYFWVKNWIRACEMLLNKDTFTHTTLRSYLRQMPEPDKNLHRQIVRHSKGVKNKSAMT